MGVQGLRKRRSPRFDSIRDLSASVQLTAEEQSFPATILNLSTQGASLVAAARIRRGDDLTLVVDSRSRGVTLTCLATARWSRPEKGNTTAFGCEFNEAIHDECFDRLSAAGYVNRRREPRFPTDLVSQARSELNRDESVRVRITDYSKGGLRIYSSDEFELGQRVLITVRDGGATIVATPIWKCRVPTGFFFGCSFKNAKSFNELQAAEQGSSSVEIDIDEAPRRSISGWVWAGALLILGVGVGYCFGWLPVEYRQTIDRAIQSVANVIRAPLL